MAGEMDWYRRFHFKALEGMRELTLQERGAYNTILDLLYSRDGDLPNDDDLIRRLVGCHMNEWRAVKSKLIRAGKIWDSSGKLMAKRVESELKYRANFSETQSKRAGKRWEKSENTDENNDPSMPSAALPGHMPNKNQNQNQNQNQSQNQKRKSPPPEAAGAPPLRGQGSKQESAAAAAGFAEFWLAYPKKVSKPAAMRAYKQALKRVDFGTLMAALDFQKKTWNPDYIKNPATWLNNDCWDDQPVKKPEWSNVL
jgi:uncharacterized protein YdaU (DUF1376 family)